MKYLLDSNFFIEGLNRFYPIDVFPSFWGKVVELANNGDIMSIDKVKNEIFISRGSTSPDPVEIWCRSCLPNNFFLDSNSIMSQYATVVRWAQSKSSHYKQAALQEFLNVDEADPFLIAHGLSNPSQYTLVTYEVSNPDLKRKVKIPEPCNELGVRFITCVDLFREMGASF